MAGVDVAERLAIYQAHQAPHRWVHKTRSDGLLWMTEREEAEFAGRDDLADGRCTAHPDLCMISGCDHTREPQATRDRERWGDDLGRRP